MICSLRFCSDSYRCKCAASFGIPKKRWLVSGAVPTVYPAAARSLLPSQSGATAPKRQCVAEVGSDGIDLGEEAAMEEASSSTALGHQSDTLSPPRGATAGIGRNTCDSQTQCTVQVSLKATQATIRPKMKSIGVQTEGANWAVGYIGHLLGIVDELVESSSFSALRGITLRTLPPQLIQALLHRWARLR